MSPVPTVGRTVHYRLDSYDADTINMRRAQALANLPEHRERPTGAQLHVGNGVKAGDVFPMVIVRVWGDQPKASVNGQVILDGSDNYWATSVVEGDGQRQWFWPERVGPA